MAQDISNQSVTAVQMGIEFSHSIPLKIHSMDISSYEKKFRVEAKNAGYSESNIQKCLNYANPLISKGYPVIYNTSHLSSLVGYNKRYLKRAVKYSSYFYREFKVPKKSGQGSRTIHEPLPSLKEIQRWILDNILYKIEISRYTKAYVPSRNIYDNVKYHRRQKVVVSLDIINFFPSIRIHQIEKIFNELGYSSNVANLLGKLCCLEDSLPQGAPTSPYLSNIALHSFDRIMEKYCNTNNIRYTRYADDLTFSGEFNTKDLIQFVRQNLESIGLRLNENKSLIMNKNQRQHVTGIIVNEKLQVPRETRKEIRQAAYYIKKFGLDDHIKHLGYTKANYLKHILGKANYALFINPKDSEIREIVKFLESQNDIATQ